MFENLHYELQAHSELLAEQSMLATTRKKLKQLAKNLKLNPNRLSVLNASRVSRKFGKIPTKEPFISHKLSSAIVLLDIWYIFSVAHDELC